MTEVVESTDEQKRAHDARTSDLLSVADFELQDLLNLAFGSEDQGDANSLGMTFVLPAGVMSGTVIAGSAWSKLVNEQLRSGGIENLAAAREREAGIMDTLRKEVRAAHRAEGRALPPRQHIHLRDAELRSGGESFQFPTARVSLSQVSAWQFGSWNPPAGVAS